MPKTKNKTQAKTKEGSSVSWRSIRQQVRGRADTPVARGRRRKIFARIAMVFLATSGLAALIGICIYLLNTQPARLQVPGATETVASVAFETDGVLTREWLNQAWSLDPRTPFAEVDIFALREELEAAGQVKSATVERVYPDKLKVVITEHVPLMRMAVRGEDGHPELLLVSRTGELYSGSDYSQAHLRALPYLTGIRPRKTAEWYRPLGDLEAIASLLQTARAQYAHLYDDWHIISLENYDPREGFPRSVIEVRTRGKIRLVFGNRDFEQQLEQLEQMLMRASSKGIGPIERIDVSLENPVLAVASDRPSGPPGRL